MEIKMKIDSKSFAKEAKKYLGLSDKKIVSIYPIGEVK